MILAPMTVDTPAIVVPETIGVVIGITATTTVAMAVETVVEMAVEEEVTTMVVEEEEEVDMMTEGTMTGDDTMIEDTKPLKAEVFGLFSSFTTGQ